MIELLARASSVGRREFLSGLSRVLAAITAVLSGTVPPGILFAQQDTRALRRRTLLDQDWRFTRDDPPGNTVSLLYDIRPRTAGRGASPALTEPPPAVIKSWVLPSGNAFVKDPARRARRPAGNLGDAVAYVAASFDDSSWQKVNIPHDSAIEGPFSTAGGGGMGRLPAAGITWYRKTFNIPAASAGKSLFLDIDGAMSYSTVWLNGQFVGGWPSGYASYRLNVTPFAKPGAVNTLAIRLDNPPASSRWYPGAGIYRNVWLVETSPVHVGQWGTYVTTPEVSSSAARVHLKVTIDNDSASEARATVETQIFEIDANDRKSGNAVATISRADLRIPAGGNATADTQGTIRNPRLWGTGARQKPNRYLAVTTVRHEEAVVDVYETPFGVRTLKFEANTGFFLNGEHLKLNGVCNHHDLGALGAAINVRALQRQLEMLAEMGCNALRTAHNLPAPELLDLADKMGFVVMDEAFDVWEAQKTPLDHHLFFADWHEQDLRSMIRRDRNHPSIILWSIGNEVGEQTAAASGGEWAQRLTSICHDEDPTRQTIAGMNSASPASPIVAPIDAIGLNYQGAGLTNRGARDAPQYPLFHQAHPSKFILGSETAATVSSRGFYTFPVVQTWTPAAPNAGQEDGVRHVSSYDLYTASWSYAPDKEFAAHEHYPYVAGEFVWTGWDYLGEPTPFDASRSSYFGIIDLAGFKKDRFYLYQAHWRPDYPMVHLLPHWTWPERIGQVTPVHVYTSGDEAELFLNGRSLGRKKKEPQQYRLRWDDVVYEPGELRVVAYKNSRTWANKTIKTAGSATRLLLTPDRTAIAGDGKDLAFVTATVADEAGNMVPRSMNGIHFELSGPGEIVATDNGDPTDMVPFPSKDRKAFNGLAMVIVRARRGDRGRIVVTARADGLREARANIDARL